MDYSKYKTGNMIYIEGYLDEKVADAKWEIKLKKPPLLDELQCLFDEFLKRLVVRNSDMVMMSTTKELEFYLKLREFYLGLPWSRRHELMEKLYAQWEETERYRKEKEEIELIAFNKMNLIDKAIYSEMNPDESYVEETDFKIVENEVIINNLERKDLKQNNSEIVEAKDSKDFIRARKEILQNKAYLTNIGFGDLEKGKKIAQHVLEKKWYRKKDLNETEISILLNAGYQKSGNNEVFNLNGKPESVVGYIEGNETLQHMSYKYVIADKLKKYNPIMEYFCKRSSNEVDIVIEKGDEKIAIEIELNQNTEHRLRSKVFELKQEFTKIYYATKKDKLRYFKDLESSQLHVGTFNDVLDNVQRWLSS